MTVNQMKKVTILYSSFIAMENSYDLQNNHLTLSDYRELERVIVVLGGGETAHTVCKNVMEWLKGTADVQVAESNGFYVLYL